MEYQGRASNPLHAVRASSRQEFTGETVSGINGLTPNESLAFTARLEVIDGTLSVADGIYLNTRGSPQDSGLPACGHYPRARC